MVVVVLRRCFLRNRARFIFICVRACVVCVCVCVTCVCMCVRTSIECTRSLECVCVCALLSQRSLWVAGRVAAVHDSNGAISFRRSSAAVGLEAFFWYDCACVYSLLNNLWKCDILKLI